MDAVSVLALILFAVVAIGAEFSLLIWLVLVVLFSKPER